eukprot:SAG31_NODE_2195_length_6220_cov_9.014703_9_plen_71_part_00
MPRPKATTASPIGRYPCQSRAMASSGSRKLFAPEHLRTSQNISEYLRISYGYEMGSCSFMFSGHHSLRRS